MNQQKQGQADPKLALQYLGEVAQTYSSTLNPVEKAPFINQVNTCMKVINEDREKLIAELKAFREAELPTDTEE